MFRFTIRDVLWFMLAIAVIAGMYWNQQHQEAPPNVEVKTVEVTVEPDGSTTTRTFDR